jgi:hypothetical protein
MEVMQLTLATNQRPSFSNPDRSAARLGCVQACHPGRVESLRYAGEVYEVNSMYLVPADAWVYELTSPDSRPKRMSCAVLIPDATPDDGPFTPMSTTHAQAIVQDGVLPWPVLTEFLRLVDASGDLVLDELDPPVVGDLSLSLNAWHFAGRSFEVNSFHFAEHDCWCYELYELHPEDAANDYLEVRVPDLRPAEGPFVPAPLEQITIHAHGEFAVPWPVLCHFLSAIRGDATPVSPSGTRPEAV